MLPQALERQEVSAAVACLRKQLVHVSATPARLQRLAGCLLAAGPTELHRIAAWPGAGHESRCRVLQTLQVRTLSSSRRHVPQCSELLRGTLLWCHSEIFWRFYTLRD